MPYHPGVDQHLDAVPVLFILQAVPTPQPSETHPTQGNPKNCRKRSSIIVPPDAGGVRNDFHCLSFLHKPGNCMS